jgi:hypothetical protein
MGLKSGLACSTATSVPTSRGFVTLISRPRHTSVAPPAARTFYAQLVDGPHGSPIRKVTCERVGMIATGVAYGLPLLRP